uniref:Uncharacterized protein n=1 Tax=Rousettus aegyptiacus TaxID=9407 RepID=A0A7J8KAK5_ROUAE|nr:hypothetical protein HJG63_007799 [Rousettus aegyptiacus]
MPAASPHPRGTSTACLAHTEHILRNHRCFRERGRACLKSYKPNGVEPGTEAGFPFCVARILSYRYCGSSRCPSRTSRMVQQHHRQRVCGSILCCIFLGRGFETSAEVNRLRSCVLKELSV